MGLFLFRDRNEPWSGSDETETVRMSHRSGRCADPLNSGACGVFVALSRGLHACYSAVPIENATARTNVVMADEPSEYHPEWRDVGGCRRSKCRADGMNWGVVRRHDSDPPKQLCVAACQHPRFWRRFRSLQRLGYRRAFSRFLRLRPRGSGSMLGIAKAGKFEPKSDIK